MRLLTSLERKFGRYALPDLTRAIIASQVAVYAVALVHPEINQAIALIPERVLAGEVWRPVTFLFQPPVDNPIFALFFWYLFYLMGSALEMSWSAFRYNVYLFVGSLATIAAAFAFPELPASNAFLQLSVFLAFATLFPTFEISIFFFLPVQIRWLALLTWVGCGFALAGGAWPERMLVLASLANYLLFFWQDILDRVRHGKRRMTVQATRLGKVQKLVHTCLVCGITSETNPKMDFRYCSQCAGSCGYCTDHLQNHKHVVAEEENGV